MLKLGVSKSEPILIGSSSNDMTQFCPSPTRSRYSGAMAAITVADLSFSESSGSRCKSNLKNLKRIFSNNNDSELIFMVTYKTNYLYKTNQKIKASNSINLISQSINLNLKNSLRNNITIDISNSFKTKRLNLKIL